MKNRVKELRQKNNLTQVQLAKMINVSQGTLSLWESGKYDIDTESLKEISRIFDTSIDYITYNTDNTSAVQTTPDNILPLHTKRIPLLGDIACGEPIFADEQHGNYVVTSDDIEADFCLRAKGDSMNGARILDGDIVFIRRQPEVENGQIAAVIIDNEATLKRVYYYPEQQKLILNPENPAYEPFVYVGSELSQVRILGKAVAFQSVLR